MSAAGVGGVVTRCHHTSHADETCNYNALGETIGDTFTLVNLMPLIPDDIKLISWPAKID